MKLLALYGGFALLGLVTGLQAQAPDPRNARNKEFIDAAQLKPNLEHGCRAAGEHFDLSFCFGIERA